MSSMVYHVVIWTETESAISMQLSLEGAIASLDDAERLAKAYAERYAAYKATQPAAPFPEIRVGVMCIPRSKLPNHKTPLTNVDDYVAAQLARAERYRTK